MIDLFTNSWEALWKDAIPESGVGSVYTRPEIVSLILDLAGYRSSEGDLSRLRVLEPSCGSGAFVTQIVERMIASREKAPDQAEWDSPHLAEALRAVDINPTAVRNLREEVQSTLIRSGCPEARASELAETWIFQTDFLLHDWNNCGFDFVLGNPPYVRIEDFPRPVLQEYRNRSTTARDRSDIYIIIGYDGAISILTTTSTTSSLRAGICGLFRDCFEAPS